MDCFKLELYKLFPKVFVLNDNPREYKFYYDHQEMWPVNERFSVGGKDCAQGERMGIRNSYPKKGMESYILRWGIMVNSLTYRTLKIAQRN